MMKKFSKILALFLALMMLVSVLAACGEKTDEGKSDNGSSETASQADNGGSDDSASKADAGDSGSASQADNGGSVAGSEQTIGEITVFVPDTMKTEDSDDPKTVWLHSNEAGTNYIQITIINSEDDAKNNLDMTKQFSAEYNPADTSYVSPETNQTWSGVEYDALGYHCVSVYTVAGDKVYYIMSAGYTLDGGELPAVLGSLK